MTQVVRSDPIPGDMVIRIIVPATDAVGSMTARCPQCRLSTMGELIGAVNTVNHAGDIIRPSSWMHLHCAEEVALLWRTQALRASGIEVHSGTQRDFIEFVQKHAEQPVVVDFVYSRPRDTRYTWSLLGNRNVEAAAIAAQNGNVK